MLLPKIYLVQSYFTCTRNNNTTTTSVVLSLRTMECMVVIVEEVPTIGRREMIDREKADFNLAIFNNIYNK